MHDQIISRLEDLLLAEYLQRDVYETYSYYLFGYVSSPIQKHLKDHMNEEMAHITTLQRYLADLGAAPLVDREPIPHINPSLEDILRFDLALEKEAVENYSEVIEMLEGAGRQYISLRIELENILVQEQEHVHDLNQWLRGEA